MRDASTSYMKRTKARPWARHMLIALLFFSGMTAVAGGLAMVISPQGGAWLTVEILASTPFRSFLVPGVLLACVIGGIHLAAGAATVRRLSIAPLASIAAAGAMCIWIATAWRMLHAWHPLHTVYLAVALVTLALSSAWIVRAWRVHPTATA